MPALRSFLDTLQSHLRRPRHPHRRKRPRPAHQPGPLRLCCASAAGAAVYRFFARAMARSRALPTTGATGSSSSCRAPTWVSWFLQPEHLFMMVRRGAAVLLAGLPSHPPGAQAAESRGALRPRRSFGAREFHAGATSWASWPAPSTAWPDRIETLLAAERRLLLDISHELRSPLARLGVAVELARSGDDLDAGAQPHPEGIRPAERAGRPVARR